MIDQYLYTLYHLDKLFVNYKTSFILIRILKKKPSANECIVNNVGKKLATPQRATSPAAQMKDKRQSKEGEVETSIERARINIS